MTHAHLSHGAPTYHAVAENQHVHLVCRQCRGCGGGPIGNAERAGKRSREGTRIPGRRRTRRAVRSLLAVWSVGWLKPIMVGDLEPEAIDRAVPAHYGDPMREQRSLGRAGGPGGSIEPGHHRDHRPGADRLAAQPDHPAPARAAAGRGHRAAGPQPARARRAARVADRRRRDDLAGRRAGRGAGAAGLPDQDAVHDPRRAGRRRPPTGRCCRWSARTPPKRSPDWACSCRARRCGSRCPVRSSPRPIWPPGRRRSTRPSPLPGGGWARRHDDRFDLLVPRSDVDKVAEHAGGAASRDLGVRSARVERRAAPASGFETDHRTIAGRDRPARLRRCTWTRAAIGARRRWPGCTTSAGRRAVWCCCTSTASATTSRRRPARR